MESEQYIPKDLPAYHDHDNLLSYLALAAKDNLPTLIIGPTGSGKTTAVRKLAEKASRPYRRANLNGGTTADDLVGRTLLNEKGTYWVDGILIDAMRKGHWMVIDELNAAGPDVLFALHSLLDDDQMIVLLENNNEVVRPHEDFRLFATMNPSGDYAGTREMSKALISRFPLVLTANYPKEAEEVVILTERTGIKEDIATALVKIATDSRDAHKKATMDFPFSTRDLLNTAKIAESLGGTVKNARVAISCCILGKCSFEDSTVIVDLMEIHLPTQ